MLYIFDLGNVIIDIDFKRVLGVWSNFSGVPLATINERFSMGTPFEQHERGEISDKEFAQSLSDEMMISLGYEQFALGWLSVFVDVCPRVVDRMQRLREQGHRVVILSNTNSLHTNYWTEKFPQVASAADKIYLSHEIGMRKPEERIYRYVLEQEQVSADKTVFFDDNIDNIISAQAQGITSIHVSDNSVIPTYFNAHSHAVE